MGGNKAKVIKGIQPSACQKKPFFLFFVITYSCHRENSLLLFKIINQSVPIKIVQ